MVEKDKQLASNLRDIYKDQLTIINKDILEIDETKNFIKKCKEEVAGEGRIIVRMSGTEPLLRVMIECKSQNKIDKLTKNVTKYFS